MGTPNPSVQKRAKEQKRKEKAEAKRAVRDAKKTITADSGTNSELQEQKEST